MDIIIDGYNLIGNEQGLTGVLEHRRNWLVQQLSRYQTIKGFPVTVVFDGWRSGGFDEVSKKVDGVSVIYSRQGEKADGVVVRMARQKGSGCVVVSSDREVRRGVEKFGATAVHAGEFNEILRRVDGHGDDDELGDGEFCRSRGGNRISKADRRRLEKLKKLRLD
jgi:predicted RNA-binding protein with PIN domain